MNDLVDMVPVDDFANSFTSMKVRHESDIQ